MSIYCPLFYTKGGHPCGFTLDDKKEVRSLIDSYKWWVEVDNNIPKLMCEDGEFLDKLKSGSKFCIKNLSTPTDLRFSNLIRSKKIKSYYYGFDDYGHYIALNVGCIIKMDANEFLLSFLLDMDFIIIDQYNIFISLDSVTRCKLPLLLLGSGSFVNYANGDMTDMRLNNLISCEYIDIPVKFGIKSMIKHSYPCGKSTIQIILEGISYAFIIDYDQLIIDIISNRYISVSCEHEYPKLMADGIPLIDIINGGYCSELINPKLWYDCRMENIKFVNCLPNMFGLK